LTSDRHHRDILHQRAGDLGLHHTRRRGRSHREHEIDVIAGLQHARERIDLVDHDGHRTNTRLDAIRDRTGLDTGQARCKERLTGFHRQLQFRAGHGIESRRRDRTTRRKLTRH
jgi:hypothetical protein